MFDLANSPAPANRTAGLAVTARAAALPPMIPAYLEKYYWWAYLRPASIALFDHTPVVSVILWGCYHRLKHAVLSEIPPGAHVLQAACVYGDLSPELADRLGPHGRLDVIDVAPIQVANCRRKLRGCPNARVAVADAAEPGEGDYDAVVCFFLLHELPDDRKRCTVDALLDRVRPGGKAIFVDYHRPDPLNPLSLPTGLVFRTLEPFAERLWYSGIPSFATQQEEFIWRETTYRGGLFQKVVARRARPIDEPGSSQ